MKLFLKRTGRFMKVGFAVTVIIWAMTACGSSSSSGDKVASFIGSLPAAHLSNDQNNSIVVTALQQIPMSSPISYGYMAAYEITAEVDSADPLNNGSSYFIFTSITPTTISGNPQENNGVYVTDLTLSWVNAQGQYYDTNNSFQYVTETDNGSASEHGTYSYLQGYASIPESGSLSVRRQYEDGSLENDNLLFSASWNAQGFTPQSQTFSVENQFNYNASLDINCSPSSGMTDAATGLKIINETETGWMAFNNRETGSLAQVNYYESDGNAATLNGSVFSGTATSLTAQGGSGQVINVSVQLSGSSFTANGNALFGENDQEWLAGQMVPLSSAGIDLTGSVRVEMNNLVFNNNYNGCWNWPMSGIMTVRSADTYVYDFSANSSSSYCGCAYVTINGIQTNNGQPVCGIDAASTYYLSLKGIKKIL